MSEMFSQGEIDRIIEESWKEWEDEKKDDPVSRRAVHEAITRWAGSMSVLIALPTREVRPLLDSIHELPSVDPKPCEDAISRQAAKEAVKKAYASGTVQALFMEILDGIPSVNPIPTDEIIDEISAEDYRYMIKHMPTVTQTPCEDAIGRQAALDCLNGKIKMSPDMVETFREYLQGVIDAIEGLASVMPKKRTGNWIECEDEVKVYCSECKEKSDYPTNYCQNCGADMRESEEQA